MTDDFRTLMDTWLEMQQAWWAQLSASDPSVHKAWAGLFDANEGLHSAEPQQRILAQLASQILVLNQHAEPFFKALQAPDAGAALADVIRQWLQLLQQQAGKDATAPWALPETLAAALHSAGLDETRPFDGTALNTFTSLFGTSGGTPEGGRTQALEAMQLLLDYQQALQQYLDQIGTASQQAASQMLATLQDAESPVTSLGALHDLWVDHYEQAYQQQAFSKAFQTAHGRISNAHMRLQRFAQQLRDARLAEHGLASRQQVQQLRREAHLLRKQVRQMQRAHTAAPDTAAAMATLRAEIDALRSEIRQAPDGTAPSRKRKP